MFFGNPWYGIKDKINSVSIEDGITSIGKDAFYECAKLSDVTIADSVTTIEEEAFSVFVNLLFAELSIACE